MRGLLAWLLRGAFSDHIGRVFIHPVSKRTMTQQEIYQTIRAMKKYGGDFVSRLGDAMLYADGHNLQRLIDTFPDYMESYGPASNFQRYINSTHGRE